MAATRAGCSEVSGSLSTISDGGSGLNRAADHSRKRSVPSDNSATPQRAPDARLRQLNVEHAVIDGDRHAGTVEGLGDRTLQIVETGFDDRLNGSREVARRHQRAPGCGYRPGVAGPAPRCRPGTRRKTATRATCRALRRVREAGRGGRTRPARCGNVGRARVSSWKPRTGFGPRLGQWPGPAHQRRAGRSTGPANTTSLLISGSRSNTELMPAICGIPRSMR